MTSNITNSSIIKQVEPLFSGESMGSLSKLHGFVECFLFFITFGQYDCGKQREEAFRELFRELCSGFHSAPSKTKIEEFNSGWVIDLPFEFVLKENKEKIRITIHSVYKGQPTLTICSEKNNQETISKYLPVGFRVQPDIVQNLAREYVENCSNQGKCQFLPGTDLSSIELGEFNFNELNLFGCRLDKRQIKLLSGAIRDKSAPANILSGTNLSGLDLTGIDLTGADLSLTCMDKTNLAGCRLDRGQVESLAESVRDKRASANILSGTNLRGLDLRGLDLRGLDLRGLDLRGRDLAGCCLDREQVRSLPEAVQENRASRDILKGTDLRELNLDRLSLCGLDLSNTRLPQKLMETNLTSCRLSKE